MFAVAADDLHDGLSNGRTFDYGGTLRPSTGSVLYSRRSRPLLKIAEDEVGVHDFLYAPCSQEMFEIEYGVTGPHPNCLDNLTVPLAAFGVPATTVTIAVNFFMNSTIAPDGRLAVLPPVSKAGQSMTFVAEHDLLVAVTSCSAPGANGGSARPLQVELTEPTSPGTRLSG
ncbi:urea carboxylase-associated family protein [Nonomuraea sp. NPDC049709]|uniref:urea carboxylase-associated family protein n=1 Tax=Nonomuraea sp. NPDC049709 TaxID=3154736 RepID=UPI003445243B